MFKYFAQRNDKASGIVSGKFEVEAETFEEAAHALKQDGFTGQLSEVYYTKKTVKTLKIA